MKEGRLVLTAFGVAALVMIAMPVATVWTMTRSGSPDQGLDGAISKAFLSASAGAVASPSPETVQSVALLLPKGMPEKTVFEQLATSGFDCATDDNAATCFRSHETTGCRDEWTIRLIFSDNGSVWSTTAKRQAACL